ncbi:calcium-binding protein (plasmid) [Rhizobium sp. T1470]|uniref:calcium-binding protein n=1 Tax=unclassified Rhizobium TaxID=2613769 RepID=UPI001AAEEE72|nr:calcium-binding protein [Rhizobium sp. T1473]MCA0806206.1 calcium-binding protein [Rhizobium sp. T1473]
MNFTSPIKIPGSPELLDDLTPPDLDPKPIGSVAGPFNPDPGSWMGPDRPDLPEPDYPDPDPEPWPDHPDLPEPDHGSAPDRPVNLGAGNNIFVGTNGDDRIWANGGNDWIFAGPGNDSVFGGPGNDTLYGNYSYSSSRGVGSEGDDDLLDGGDGDDRLVAGDGIDTLTGGADHDRFVFTFNDPMSGPSFERLPGTRLTDFNPTEDKIVLDAADFDSFGRPLSEQGTVGNFINGRSPIFFTDRSFASASEAANAASHEVRGDILVYCDANGSGAVLAYVDGENTAHEFGYLENKTMADLASMTSNNFEYC